MALLNKPVMIRSRNPRSATLVVLLLLASHLSAQITSPTLSNRMNDAPSQSATEQDQLGEAEQAETETQGLQDLVDTLELDLDLSEQPLSDREMNAAEELSRQISATEWLGALGPVSLSPFFGLTCLSGIAVLGDDLLPAEHFLRQKSSPLRNPWVFVTFLILTVVTSIPKLSKVSKPFAQAVDQIETYSVIIILLVIRVMGSFGSAAGEPPDADIVMQAGVVEFSVEAFLMLATVVNLIVVNTIKFFFEVMIWITPIPFVDAIFEATNKSVCLCLAGIYAYSPTLATFINLSLMAVCLLMFVWVRRRQVFYRTVLVDFVRLWLNIGATKDVPDALVVFPVNAFEGIPGKARCELTRTPEGWRLSAARWFRAPLVLTWDKPSPVIKSGLLMNSLTVDGTEFCFGKRSSSQLAAIATKLDASYDNAGAVAHPRGSLATEMA